MARKCKTVFKPCALKIVGTKIVRRTKDWIKLLNEKLWHTRQQVKSNTRKKALLQAALSTATYDFHIERHSRQIRRERRQSSSSHQNQRDESGSVEDSITDPTILQFMESLGNFLSDVKKFPQPEKSL